MINPSLTSLPSIPSSKQTNLILGLYIFFISLFLLLRAGKFLIPIFPLSSFIVGVFLYRYNAFAYISFTWWMFFLSPLIRRIIDIQSGYLTFGPWGLTPLLVTIISATTFFKDLPKIYRGHRIPFFLCAWSVTYCTIIGLLFNPKNKVILSFLSWFGPIALGYYLFTRWREYPIYSKVIRQTFFWGVLIMGTYGVFQFLVAPDWDRFYLNNISAVSFGRPTPLEIRVFSSQSAPQSFATIMMVGLLLLLSNHPTLLYFPTTVVGYLGFLLSMARTAWLSWLVALPILATSLKPKLQMRFVITVLVTALLITPIVTMEPFAQSISDRLTSLTDPKGDVSVNDRQAGYEKLLGQALSKFLGDGFAAPQEDTAPIGGSDSTILPMLFEFGWFGTIPYLGGVLLLIFEMFQSKVNRFDAFNSASRAIVVGIFSQIGFNMIFTEASGSAFWSFLGLGLAANRYYKNLELEKSQNQI